MAEWGVGISADYGYVKSMTRSIMESIVELINALSAGAFGAAIFMAAVAIHDYFYPQEEC